MNKLFYLLSFIFLMSLGCHRKIEQSSMFHGRGHVNKKSGIYDAGMMGKKSVNMQISEEYDKLSKHDTDPQKAARKALKEHKKRELKSQRKREKQNKKVRVKLKTPKTKTEGEL